MRAVSFSIFHENMEVSVVWHLPTNASIFSVKLMPKDHVPFSSQSKDREKNICRNTNTNKGAPNQGSGDHRHIHLINCARCSLASARLEHEKLSQIDQEQKLY